MFPPPPDHPLSQAEIIALEADHYHSFVNLALFLSVFTGMEIVVIFTPSPGWFIMTTLITLSLIKFICVILWFMHLIYDPPLLFIVFIAGMILAAGTMTALLRLMSAADVDPAVTNPSGFNYSVPPGQTALV